MPRLDVRSVPRAAHFHQDEGRDGRQHESGKRERKTLSTVSTADARTIRKARMAKVMWSRSRRSENMRITTPNKAR